MPERTIVPPWAPDQSVAHCHGSLEDAGFWSRYLLPRFDAYLSEAGSYTVEQQAAQRSCLRTAVATLGPQHPHPHVRSALTKKGVPIEFSFNRSDAHLPTARFYIEPLGPRTGTDEDPFREQAFRLKGRDEMERAKSQKRSDDWIPNVFLGVDFVGPDRTMKHSFCPLLKLLAIGAERGCFTNYNTVVLDVVRKLPGCGANMSAAVDSGAKVKRSKLFFNLVSADCVHPSNGKGRVKLYARINCLAFACICDAITLGGRLNDEVTMEGVRRLQSIWHLLLNDPACKRDADYSRPVAVESHLRGIEVNWEITNRQPVPQAKVYVPIYLFHANDLEANRSLCSVFRKHNWHDWAEGRYAKMLRTTFPEADFATTNINTWISFCYYQQRGSYMTLYHCPPL
ncbi:TdiB protein [Colletotrichum somersetense]|nr:TdiB protein [Colletotrichum somersetense]